MKSIVLVAAFALSYSTAYAVLPPPTGITYVDATDGPNGNTSLASGGEFSPPRSNSPFNFDNYWTNRTFGNDNTIYTSNDFSNPSEDAPGLVTQITGLVPAAAYHMYAYLWVDNMPNSNWRLKASLTQTPPLGDGLSVSFGARATASTTLAPPAVAGDFVVTPLLFEGNRTFLQASLGQIDADAGGMIRVWIDDYSGIGAGISNRTWYDGVGYALVPEPGTIAMLAGAFPLSLTHRRKSVPPRSHLTSDDGVGLTSDASGFGC